MYYNFQKIKNKYYYKENKTQKKRNKIQFKLKIILKVILQINLKNVNNYIYQPKKIVKNIFFNKKKIRKIKKNNNMHNVHLNHKSYKHNTIKVKI